LLAATLYKKNNDWNQKFWNIVLTERYAGVPGMLLHINGKFTMGGLNYL
jgi:hypothetical protein